MVCSQPKTEEASAAKTRIAMRMLLGGKEGVLDCVRLRRSSREARQKTRDQKQTHPEIKQTERGKPVEGGMNEVQFV